LSGFKRTAVKKKDTVPMFIEQLKVLKAGRTCNLYKTYLGSSWWMISAKKDFLQFLPTY